MLGQIFFFTFKYAACFERAIPSKLFEYAATEANMRWTQGFSKTFANENIDNCKIFRPGDVNDAILKLDELSLSNTSRKSLFMTFLEKK